MVFLLVLISAVSLSSGNPISVSHSPVNLSEGMLSQNEIHVALVSGSESPSYQAHYAMSLLKDYLEENYPVKGTIINSEEGSDQFDNLDALKSVDTAVFFVRRKTPSPDDLEIIKSFVESGKGFVALRPTSHAWENWPTFDQEVLGATYKGTFHTEDVRSPSMDRIVMDNHEIFSGIDHFYTDLYMYDYEDIQDDVDVIMHGHVGEETTPLAWTRIYNGGRIFRLVPGNLELFHEANYLKMIGNGVMWVTQSDKGL